MSRAAFAALVWLSLLPAGCGEKTREKTQSTDSNERRDEASDEKRPARAESGLSRASRKLACDGLKQDLVIDFYVSREQATEKGVAAIEALLKRYPEATFTPDGGSEQKSKVRVNVIEVKTDADREIAKAQGIQEQTVAEAQGQNSVVITKLYLGVVFKYGAEKDVLPWWPPDDTDNFEYALTLKARELRDRVEHVVLRIGVVANKGGVKLGDPNIAPGQPINLSELMRQYFPTYQLEEVDLLGGEVAIDPALRGLLITQPGKDYSEKELRRIDEFMMRGQKGLVIAASAVNVSVGDATMTATLDRHGLEPLLAGYGMDLQNEAVLDFGSPLSFQLQNAAGMPVTVLAPSIYLSTVAAAGQTPRVDVAFAPFFRMPELAFPYASPIVLHAERQPDAKLRVVARSTDKATLDKRAVKSMAPTDAEHIFPTGTAEERTIAVAVEGVLASAFPSGSNQGVVAPAKSAAPSRVLLIASSQFFANPFAYSTREASAGTPFAGMLADRALAQIGTSYAQGNTGRMAFAFKSAVAWLAADADEAALASKLTVVAAKDGSKPAAASSASSSSILKLFGQ